MDIERVIVRMGADATQYLQVFNVVEARLVAFSSFLVEEMLRSSMRLASEFERMGIAFEVMSGSAEKGRKVLEDIVDLAIRTPFTTQELVKSGKQAMAFGFEMNDIIPVLSRLGDVSIATGSDMDRLILALGQVRTTGRLMGQELRQFTNAGVPILQYLAKAMGVTEAQVPQLVRMGRVGFNDVAEAFNMMTNAGGRFFGMMERTNLETIFGKWQNLTENIQKFSRKVGEAIFQAFDVKGLLTDWNDALNGVNMDKVQDGMKQVADYMKAIWNVTKAAAGAVSDFWSGLPPEVQAVVKTLGVLVATAFAAHAAFRVLGIAFAVAAAVVGPFVSVVAALIPIITTVVTVAAGLAFTFLGSTTVLALVAKLLIAVGVTALILGADLGFLTTAFKAVAGAVWEFAAGIAGFAADAFLGTIEQVGRSLTRLFTIFGEMKGVFGDGFQGIVGFLSIGETQQALQMFVAMSKLAFKTLWEWVKLEWDVMWKEIGISLEIGLKRAFANSVHWFAQQWRKLFDAMGMQSVGRSSAELQRENNTVNAVLDAERVRRMGEASADASRKLDDLTTSLLALPEAQKIRDDAEVGRFAAALGQEMFKFRLQAEAEMLQARRDEAGKLFFGPAAPASALAGAVGPAGVQSQYDKLFMEAAQAAAELDARFREFQGGTLSRKDWEQSLRVANASRKAFQDFHDTLTGVAGAARKAAEISKTMEISAETRAYWLDLEKDFKKGTDAMVKFRHELGMIQEAVVGPWVTADRKAAAAAAVGVAGIFGNPKMAGLAEPGSPEEEFALFKTFDALKKSLPKMEDRRPPAAMEGSREAAEIIGRHQNRTLTVNEEIRAAVIQANEIHREAARYQREVAEGIRSLQNSGTVVPLPVKPGG